MGIGCVTLETMQTMKPFSSMLYDSTVFASWRILPCDEVRSAPIFLLQFSKTVFSYRSRSASAELHPSPSLQQSSLLLGQSSRYQLHVIKVGGTSRMSRTVSDGSASITNFCCFRSYTLLVWYDAGSAQRNRCRTLNVSFIFAFVLSTTNNKSRFVSTIATAVAWFKREMYADLVSNQQLELHDERNKMMDIEVVEDEGRPLT